jgi:predicted acylesterase/phospholipase RssA
VTTNLDAQRTTIWDMGKIAASGDPGALDLFRNVLTASASIPGVFSPVLIDVEANGRRFAEMQVDGGVTTNVLILPEAILMSGTPVFPSQLSCWRSKHESDRSSISGIILNPG